MIKIDKVRVNAAARGESHYIFYNFVSLQAAKDVFNNCNRLIKYNTYAIVIDKSHPL